jgi:hypothetical protein
MLYIFKKLQMNIPLAFLENLKMLTHNSFKKIAIVKLVLIDNECVIMKVAYIVNLYSFNNIVYFLIFKLLY